MLKINKLIATSLLVMVACSTSFAQTASNSPYTRYGYGQLVEPVTTSGRAMGGTAYASRGTMSPNFMNPASYSSVDSLTFIFDVAASGYSAFYTENGNSESYINGGLSHVTMQFPVARNIGMSFGLVPFSTAGYKFGMIDEDALAQSVYAGTGGLNQTYVGASFRVFKNLSLGVNASYLFGNLQHSYVPVFYDETVTTYSRHSEMSINHVKFDFGLQYTKKMTGNREFTIGAVFAPGGAMNGESIDLKLSESKVDTLNLTKGGFEMPMNVGLGINYKWKQKFTVAADVQFQNWAKSQYFQRTDTLNNRYRVALGFEYIPKQFDRSYTNNIRYRAGVNYNRSYLNINGHHLNEVGVSVGAGLPLRGNKSMVNLALEYTMLQAPGTNYLKENYLKFTLNMTINELWFFKNKFQ